MLIEIYDKKKKKKTVQNGLDSLRLFNDPNSVLSILTIGSHTESKISGSDIKLHVNILKPPSLDSLHFEREEKSLTTQKLKWK